MREVFFSTVVAFVTAAAVAATTASAGTASCPRGLHIMVARGSEEPDGAGIFGSLANDMARRVGGSVVVPVDYPAKLTNPVYGLSVAAGVESMKNFVDSYAAACPGSKMAILGFSQGAHVAADVICGGTVDNFPPSAALPRSLIQDTVVAAVLLGDPTYVANASYGRGSGVRGGVFRRHDSKCESYADRLVSYCDAGDIYCDGGRDPLAHIGYFSRYGAHIVDYVVRKYRNATASGDGGSGIMSKGANFTSTINTSSVVNASTFTSVDTSFRTNPGTSGGSSITTASIITTGIPNASIPTASIPTASVTAVATSAVVAAADRPAAHYLFPALALAAAVARAL